MPLEIIRGDVTKVRADAIVDTANPEPVVGRGTDAAVHAAAGPELLEARKSVGPLAPGSSAATPAFGLPAKYVLHTAGPVWEGGGRGEKELLGKAYASALGLALELGCASVAFPLMGAGTNGFPDETALSVATEAISDFLAGHDMLIYLALFNEDAVDVADRIFGGVRSYVDRNYAGPRADALPGDAGPRYPMGYASAAHAAPPAAAKASRAEKPSRKKKEKTDTLLSGISGRRERRRRTEEIRRQELSSSSFSEASYDEEEQTGEEFPEPAVQTNASALEECCAPVSDEDLRRYLGQQDVTFSEYLVSLLREMDLNAPEVYTRACVSKQLFSKIISDRDYRPKKNTALQLAIGMRLDVAGTRKFLEKAGYALTRSSKSDLVVQYYLEHRIYSIPVINMALEDSDEPLLTTGLAR